MPTYKDSPDITKANATIHITNETQNTSRDDQREREDDTCHSLATEQILRYDEQDRNVDTINIIARLRQDITHERQLRKDVQSQLRECQNNFDESRRKGKDFNMQVQRLQTEIISNRHEKTHLESRNQELAADINKFSEKIDYYKSQLAQYKNNYDREYKIRVQNEQKVADSGKQIEHLNSQLDSNHLEKRSRLIAEEQYRSAILERDRNIKRQANEIDQLTNRLAESSKMTDGIRKDKSSKDEEILSLKGKLKKATITFEKANEDYLDLKKEHNKTLSEVSMMRRTAKGMEEDLKQSNGQYKKKIDEVDRKEQEKNLLLNTMSELKAKQNHKEARYEERQLLCDNEIFANKEALRIAREQASQYQNELCDLKVKHKVHSKTKSSEISDLESRLRHVQQVDVKELNEKITTLTVDNEKMTMDRKLVIKKLKKERGGTEGRIASFQNEADSYKQRISSLEPLIERLSFKVDELASDRSKLVERVNDLENENLKLSKELSTVAFTNGSGPINRLNAVNGQLILAAAGQAAAANGSAGTTENRYKLSSLRKKEGRLSDELSETQFELKKLMSDLKKKEQENSIYFNTITDLQTNKFSLETRISALQDKDKSHLDTLSKMTYKADEIAKDAQKFAFDEQRRNSSLKNKYQNVVEKLREADLEIERLRRQVAIDGAIKSLKY